MVLCPLFSPPVMAAALRPAEALRLHRRAGRRGPWAGDARFDRRRAPFDRCSFRLTTVHSAAPPPAIRPATHGVAGSLHFLSSDPRFDQRRGCRTRDPLFDHYLTII